MTLLTTEERLREEYDREHAAYMKRPSAGIAKVGPSRWFWVYWSSMRDKYDGTDPHRFGFADSFKAAMDECGGVETFMRDTLRPGRFCPDAYLALEWRSIFAARRRKPNTKDREAKATEYVYHGTTCKHRITKKTAKRIFIVADCYHPDDIDTTGGVFRVKQMALDRAKLEADEEVFGGMYWGGFFTLVEPEDQPDNVPECLAALGLLASATKRQVKSRFRKLSKQHHPDHGGNADEFRELLKNYEQALTMVEA